MIRIVCFIKPHRLEQVKSAIAAHGISGMSVADVRGTGNSPEDSTIYEGPGVVALPIRARIEVIAAADQQEGILEAIRSSCQTGEPDDGKVFVEPVADAIRIRTGERGRNAL